MKIAFTGATGQFGTLLAEETLKRTEATNLIALARTPERASALREKGIEVRAFDYDQPASLAGALEGVDRLLLVSGNAVGQRLAQHAAVITAAEQAGVSFLAYTSFLHTDQASIIAVVPEHQQTEQLLAESGVKTALLRNGWYTENFQDLVTGAAASGSLVTSAGTGRISSASRQDYAEAAAVVLTEPTAQAATYELGGDTSWTMADLAAQMSTITGSEVSTTQLSSADHRAALLSAGQPEGLADFLVSTDAGIAARELEDPQPGTLSTLLGRPTTPLADTLASWLR